MPYTNTGRDAMLAGGLGDLITHVSLHTGNTGTGGGNEVAGSGYARQPVTWYAPASNGIRSNQGAIAFTVPAGSSLLHVGFWDQLVGGSASNFYGYAPINGAERGGAAVDNGTDVFTSVGHGLATNDRVIFFPLELGSIPTPLVDGDTWYVVSGTSDTFQISTTLGGGAQAVGGGTVGFQKVVPQSFGSIGVFSIPDSALQLRSTYV